ncbi:MAG: BCCT family transporter [Nitrosopumilaceae archaeon]|nr:BCCT family transporter [Nitrosopumilaceae archaeon]NIU00064.1 BCCT family transporter [Nitrosopumilaceae archaeon]NIU86443.1 BCCT family transporter [Nitrosopumilaceae archaeon]NIV65152.1 BCCT family transporter [Nitrosopumilaceae archaeon]NIX60666.1 BCCT family transporter [Nitrosopumilaceae archaeon]
MVESEKTDNLAKSKFGLKIHPTVFLVSAGLIISLVIATLFLLDQVSEMLDIVFTAITDNAKWFFIIVVNIVLLFVLYLMLSEHGKIRLGGSKAKPSFNMLTWFTMLFTAGMGIGIMFFGVAEPVFHFSSPPIGDGGTEDAAQRAMGLSFLHWGLHPWAIYALVALCLAFFSYNKGLPLTIRSAFYPILGYRVMGPIGSMIDILAVVATLFGVATSLGFGVQQINAGLNHAFGIDESSINQVILISVITGAATISVVTGLNRGIRRLSEFNMTLALSIMVFVAVMGPTVFLFDLFVQSMGYYVQNLPELSTWTESFQATNWQGSWTIFYWAWWISWSPFVGMFIARVSYGRTIREFLLGVLFVPTIVTLVWMTVFGGTAIHEELFGEGGMAEQITDNMAKGLFVLLDQFPLVIFVSVAAVIAVAVFFVTSSDSGSLVIDIITAGGSTEMPVKQRVFWAVLEGVVASVLLVGGGLQALQTMAISTGLPFAVIILIMGVGLWRGLRRESRKKNTISEQNQNTADPENKKNLDYS